MNNQRVLRGPAAVDPGPTRDDPIPVGQARLLATLRTSDAPLTLAELAAASDLHPNTVRWHLDPLLGRGEVTRSAAPSPGRGRPAWRYAAAGPVPTEPNELTELATALADALTQASEDPGTAALEAGRAWGTRSARRHLLPGGARDATVELVDRMGFAPRRREAPHGDDLLLTRCPLLAAARARPGIVCRVHLGLVQGVLAAHGAPPGSADLAPFSDADGCRLTLREVPA